MILSKKYKEELDKIIMDKEMKQRILNNVLNEERQIKRKKYPLKRIHIQIAVACFLFVICFSATKNFIYKNRNLPKQVSQNTYDENKDSNNKDSNNEEQNKSNYNEENNNSIVQEHENVEHNNNMDTNKVQNNTDSKINKVQKDTDIKTNKNIENEDNAKNYKDTTQEETSPKDAKNEDYHEPCIVADVNPIKEYKTIEEAEEAVKFKINTIKMEKNKFNINNISVISSTTIQIKYNNGKDTIDFRACRGVYDISGDYSKYEFEKNLSLNDKSIKIKGHTKGKVNIALWQIGDISYSISAPNGIEQEKVSEMIKSSL